MRAARNYSKLWNFLAFFFSLSVFHLEYSGSFFRIYNFIAVLFQIIVFFPALILSLRSLRYDRISVVVILYILYGVGITVFYQGDVLLWTKISLSCVNAVLIARHCASKNHIGPLTVITQVFSIFAVITLADVIRNFPPNQLFNLSIARFRYTGLLGYQNGLGIYFIPVIALDLYHLTVYRHRKLRSKIVYYASILTVLLIFLVIWSATALCGALMLLLCTAVWKKSRNQSLVFVIAGFLIFVFVVLSNTVFPNVLQNLIVNVLHRDLTFSGRTVIWSRAIDAIAKNWLFGVGRDFSRGLITFRGVSSAHNQLLDVLYLTGAVGLAMFCYAIVATALRQKSAPSYRRILYVCFGLLFLIMQFESYSSYYGYCMFFLSQSLCVAYPGENRSKDGRL